MLKNKSRYETELIMRLFEELIKTTNTVYQTEPPTASSIHMIRPCLCCVILSKPKSGIR